MSNERKLNTDGKSTYNILKTRLQVINDVIDYDKEDHRLYFLNKIISNLNQYLLHVYHGVSKECCLCIIANTSGDLITESADPS